jgi:predicted RNase H-like HicB family nuclease
MPGHTRLHQPGRTREEALANIREAIELCLENREAAGWQSPAEYEVVRLAVPT